MKFDVKRAPAWLKDNGASLVYTTGLEWVCLYVEAGKEIAVVRTLRQLGLIYYLPILISSVDAKKRASPGKPGNQAFIAPLWSRYVFCQVDRLAKEKVASEKHIVSVLETSDQSGIVQSLIDQKSREDRSFQDGVLARVQVSPGESFFIHSGPFQGYEARTLSVRGGRDAYLEIGPPGRSIRVRASIGNLTPNPTKRTSVPIQDLLFEDDIPTAKEVVSEKSDEVASSEREAVEVSLNDINAALIEYFRRHPEKMYDLSPYKFEELVAEILEDMGASVRLTPQARDGGRDILASVSLPFGEILTIVECKKNRADNLVGVDIVERFMYTIDRKDNASFGLVVTTSNFTAGARQVEKEYPNRLGLRDFESLASWLSSYGTWSLQPRRGIWMPDQNRRMP